MKCLYLSVRLTDQRSGAGREKGSWGATYIVTSEEGRGGLGYDTGGKGPGHQQEVNTLKLPECPLSPPSTSPHNHFLSFLKPPLCCILKDRTLKKQLTQIKMAAGHCKLLIGRNFLVFFLKNSYILSKEIQNIYFLILY